MILELQTNCMFDIAGQTTQTILSKKRSSHMECPA